MRWSFVRLVGVSLLLSWTISFAVLAAYIIDTSWTDERVQTDGVFLAYEILDAETNDDRAARLSQLRQHYWVPLSVASIEEVQQRVGRTIHPGEHIPLRNAPREEWYFIVSVSYTHLTLPTICSV